MAFTVFAENSVNVWTNLQYQEQPEYLNAFTPNTTISSKFFNSWLKAASLVLSVVAEGATFVGPETTFADTKALVDNNIQTVAKVVCYAKTETYSKTEIDNLFANVYTKAEVDAINSLTNYYTKTYIDDNIYKKTEVYAKSETYSKTEIDNKFGSSLSFSFSNGTLTISWAS